MCNYMNVRHACQHTWTSGGTQPRIDRFLLLFGVETGQEFTQNRKGNMQIVAQISALMGASHFRKAYDYDLVAPGRQAIKGDGNDPMFTQVT